MTSNFFIRHSLVGFCLKILNSTVVIGLYYGFLTTACIGPSYLFLIRARVMEKGSETEIAATTGFLTGRVMMFISIYYAPLHLALNRPHTLTFLTLPYLFFNYVYQNDKHSYWDGWGWWEPYPDSGYKNPNPNSIRNFRTYKVFLNNLFFQLLNPVLFPSSIFIRLMHIYLFRSNNKLLFLTSSFVGWLIGHIFLMKCIGLVLVWFKKKNSIKSKITMIFDKYTLLQLRNYSGQLFIVFAFAIFARYSGRAVLPYVNEDEMTDYDERDMGEIEAAIDAEREENNEEDITVYFSENEKTSNNTNIQKKTKIVPPVERGLVSILFDYQQWIRPLRYIQNDHLARVVRDENSQFFFQTCESDGKKRISFTYPPHLSTFLNIMEKKIDLFRTDKTSNNDNELYNSWISRNKEKKNQLSNELFQRAKILDKKVKKGKKFNLVDVLENRVRLSDDRSRRKYLPKIYDPFLNGPARGEIQKSVSPLMKNETTNPILINKIHGLLLCMNKNSPELEQKIDKLDRKLVFTEMAFFFQLMSKFSEKSVSNFHFDELYLFPEHEQVKIYSEEKKRKRNLLFDAIRTNPFNHKTIFNRVLCSEIKEISKEVPRWNYELIDETELMLEPGLKESEIRSPSAERVVLFNMETGSVGPHITGNPFGNEYTAAENPLNELVIPAYFREPDFHRDLIRGSWRPLRRKTVTSKLFQGNGHVHSPLFLEMINNNPSFFFDALEEMWKYLKEYFRKLMKPGTDNLEFLEFQKRANEREKDQKEREEEYDKDEAANTLKRVEASWESLLYGLVIRNFVLLFQSKFRKYILLPSLIITKNIIRMLLFQNPEWSEDFRDWERETHLNCTYHGTPVYNNELPYEWLAYGLQIRVLFPFVLKAWHDKPKVRSTEKKRYTEKRFTEKRISPTHLWFLTAFGTVLESYPQEHVPNPFAFLGPILKQIRKQLKKDFRKFYNEREKKESRILLEEFKEIEIPKNAPISKSNPMIEESPLRIQSITEKRIKATEKRIKYLNDKTKKILKEIEKMKKEEVITDPTRLELLKNSWKIFKRRNVRLIRKSYCFFQIFMERLYMDIGNMDIFNINYVGLTIDYLEHFLTSSIVQRYLNSIKFTIKFTIKLTRDLFELTKKMVNKSIYNKKNEQSIDKTNQSIIPFMSIIDKQKPWNITDMNSQNSCDVSSLSQAYVLFKLSQMQVSNGYKYKLRSILESPGRSFFLKNEIKDYLLKLQGGRFHSKLRHKNRPDSIMNQWTNWLKIHYQYALPQSAWSRLVPQKWRNTIHEHRVSQNKDLLEYDSSEKIQLIFSKKQKVDLLEQIDLLKNKKKIKKQYGYDLFAYQYINYVDKQKSYIYGYTSPCYNTPKNIKELFDIMGDSFIQNYISEDGILDENKPDRKYCHWRQRRMGMNGKRRRGMNAKRRRMAMNGKSKKNSITNAKLLTPSFGFFSKIDAYKKNPWILPLNFLFMPFYGKNNITDQVELALQKKEYEIHNNLKLYLDKYYPVRRFPVPRRYDLNRFRKHISAEKNFLLKKYWDGFYIRTPGDDKFEDKITWSTDLISRMSRMKNPTKMLIASIKKADLDLETFVRVVSDDTCFIADRDIEEVKENLIYSIEPIRFSRKKNYEQSFLYQTISVSLKHKRQMLNSEKRRLDQKITENKDKNHYDLLVPENLLSPRRRRELRILICLNHRNRKTMDRNTIKAKEKKNSSEVFTKKKDLDSDTKKLRNLKFFLWPNYRFEDLACMNRYWFDTHNGSRFSILRIRMYPRLD